MATTPTDKIRLLLSIIQLCVNKIISQFSTLNPIPVFNPVSENSTESISVVRAQGGGVLPYTRYMGMCRCEGYGFQAV